LKKRTVSTNSMAKAEDKKPRGSVPVPALEDFCSKQSWCWLDNGWICAIVEGFRIATVSEKVSILNAAKEKRLGIRFFFEGNALAEKELS